jgi:hypothetical protein
MSSNSRRAGVSRWLGISALAALSGLLAGPQSAAAAPETAAVTGQWTLTTPALNDPDDSFRAVDGVSSVDQWAVGATALFTTQGVSNTLIEHWNGTKWTIIPSPNRTNLPSPNAGNSNVLNAVEAISATNVWAVGRTGINGFNGSGSLIEHWNGGSWSIVPSPDAISPTFNFFNVLNGVSGTSATDAWAVGWNGFLLEPALHRATIEHWDGTQWKLVPAPAIGNDAQNVVLEAVNAVSPDNAWATGYYSDDSIGNITHPLTLHWNGTQWSVVPGADISLSQTVNQINLNAVKAVSANDIWAAGAVSYLDANNVGQSQGLIEHWNGTRWSIVASANPDATATNLTGLAPFAGNDIWAVGATGSPDPTGARDPLLEHWDGASWSVVSAPRPDKNLNCGFFGAFATADGAAAVGGCVAIDPTAPQHAIPLAEEFATGATPPPPPAPPAAPSGLTGRALSTSQIQLAWKDNSTNEGGFTVERCTGSGCTNFTQIALVGAGVTAFVDTGRAANASYSYRVQAFNLGGVSAFSNTATVRTPRR